jgi:hypothetical protein
LESVQQLRNLEELWVFSDSVSEYGLRRIAEIHTLKRLSLGSPDLTDDSLAVLTPLANLEELDLYDCRKLTGAALLRIRGLKNLKSLHTCENMTLEHIHLFSNLEELDVFARDRFTDDDLARLGRLPRLRRLYVNCQKCTDAGLTHLTNLKNLEYLELLFFPDVTEEGLHHLKAIKSLRQLTLNLQNRISRSTMDELRDALPACEVVDFH